MRYWSRCLSLLENEVPSHQFNLWIRPLQADEKNDRIQLYAPNPYVFDWVKSNCLDRLNDLVAELVGEPGKLPVSLSIGSRPKEDSPPEASNVRQASARTSGKPAIAEPPARDAIPSVSTNLTPEYTFENYVEGKSNQIAKAAALQVGENPGRAYNPLFVYGGVGLGKTHLMHAVGLKILQNNPKARVTYVNSERFVNDMVQALRHNKMAEFKSVYRSLDALLIDDIQFFAGKERSQEEFFHTFNALAEANCQIILSSDRFPKELSGLEERLKSRFSWGLTVAIEPPDLETRVAILKSKAAHLGSDLPNEVAFFVGKRVRSNIRELEGALRRLVANSQFSGNPITLEFAKNALKDMLAAQDKMVSIDNIQKTTAEYFQIRVSELLSKKRSRSIARPRQIAMTLAKELTSHSLPEIGEAFGGRDHTTVLHATRKIKELMESDTAVAEDYANLLRTLTN